MPKVAENKKKSQQNPPKDPLEHQIWFYTKERAGDYLVSVSKTDLLVLAAKTKVNQVLGLPLTVSTRRVEPITSKTMVSEEVSMLAKS